MAALLRETTERFCRGELDMRLASTVTYMCKSLLYAWSRAAQQDASPALTPHLAMASNDDEWDAVPDNEEAVLDLLRGTMREARALEAEEMETQS